jgi:hemolysin activation/secretion protein
MVKRFRSMAIRTGAACLFVPVLAAAQAPAMTESAIGAVRVEGNTLLPAPTLTALTRDVVGMAPTLPLLTALAARIQAAYRDAGYGGVVAYVPVQESLDGGVAVRVVEGRLAVVRVSGNAHFSTANILAGLPDLRQGATPLVRAIDRDIQLTNSNPAKQVNVSLRAGTRPGEIAADVKVADEQPLRYLLGYNNTGNSMTGRHRISVGIEHANLFGRDHVGTLQYQTAPENPGRVRIFSGGYRIPLYAHAASFDAFVAHSTVNNGTTATTAGPLTFTGRGTIIGLRGNRHLARLGEYDHQLTLGLDRRDYKDDCAIGDFGAAGCGSAAVDVTTVPVSLTYTGQKGSSAFAYGFNAGLSVNAGGSAARTFEAARPGAKRRYVLSRVAAFFQQPLTENVSVYARMEAQVSAHALISAEKFGLGGSGSVRGYAEREMSGDSGVLLRFEAATGSIDTWGLPLRPYLFVDHGRVTNRGNLPCLGRASTSCHLTGAGIGARVSLYRHAGASLDVGRALEDGTTSSQGDVRAHLALNLAF